MLCHWALRMIISAPLLCHRSAVFWVCYNLSQITQKKFELHSFWLRSLLLLQPFMIQNKDGDHKEALRAPWHEAQQNAEYCCKPQRQREWSSSRQEHVQPQLTARRRTGPSSSRVVGQGCTDTHPEYFQMLASCASSKWIWKICILSTMQDLQKKEKRLFFNSVHFKASTLSEGISPAHVTYCGWHLLDFSDWNKHSFLPKCKLPFTSTLWNFSESECLFAKGGELLARLNKTPDVAWLHHSPSYCVTSAFQMGLQCATAETEEPTCRRQTLSQRTASHMLLSFCKLDFVKVIS